MGALHDGHLSLLKQSIKDNNATVISIFVGMFVYFMILLLMRGVTEQELRRIPKGTVLIRFAKKLRLL